ncbi:MAG: hypothetical protein QW484_00855 [Candidatus Pacearchaeota archaeon]
MEKEKKGMTKEDIIKRYSQVVYAGLIDKIKECEKLAKRMGVKIDEKRILKEACVELLRKGWAKDAKGIFDYAMDKGIKIALRPEFFEEALVRVVTQGWLGGVEAVKSFATELDFAIDIDACVRKGYELAIREKRKDDLKLIKEIAKSEGVKLK